MGGTLIYQRLQLMAAMSPHFIWQYIGFRQKCSCRGYLEAEEQAASLNTLCFFMKCFINIKVLCFHPSRRMDYTNSSPDVILPTCFSFRRDMILELPIFWNCQCLWIKVVQPVSSALNISAGPNCVFGSQYRNMQFHYAC